MVRLRSVYVERGSDFLGESSVGLLKRSYLSERDVRARQRLHAAFLRKQGRTLVEIARVLGRPFNTVSDWLRRFEVEGLKSAKDKPRSGKPVKLTGKQLNQLRKDLLKNPNKLGYDEFFWSTRLVQHHVEKKFKVSFVARHMTRLIHKLGFSSKKPRPQNSKANPEEWAKFKKKASAWYLTTQKKDSKPYV